MAKETAQLTPKAKRTKELIYRTALELLAEKGFKSVTIRDICAQANVSVGAFYSYFESKNAIIFEVIREVDHYFTDVVAQQLQDLPAAESILEYFRYYANYLNHKISLDTLCVLFSVEDIWLTRYRPTQQALTAQIMAGQLSGEILTDYPARYICDYLFDLVRGIVFTWCSQNCSFRLENRIDFQVRLALRGILHDPDSVKPQPPAENLLQKADEV